MSIHSKFSPQTRALWQQRFAAAGFTDIDLDYWNTIAFSPAKVHPRLMAKLGIQPTPLQQVCREPVLLAQTIVGHRPPTGSSSALDDSFLEHCMEIDPLQVCQCGDLQRKQAHFQQGLVPESEFFAAVTREFLRTTAARFTNTEPSEEDHEDLEEVIRREQQWMYVFEDAQAFLLASRGRRRMNIISNMWYATEQIFGRKAINGIPLGEFFWHIITSFKVNARKPKPEVFLKAEELTGSPLRKHLMVGDSISNDILASLDAGYEFAVLVHRDGELSDEEIEALPDNVLVVENLMQLLEVLP